MRATTGAKSDGTLQYAQAARVPVSGSFGGAFPGVAPGVGFLQVGDGEPEVFLRGGDRAMAEHLLDEADVGPVAALDEMGCAGVRDGNPATLGPGHLRACGKIKGPVRSCRAPARQGWAGCLKDSYAQIERRQGWRIDRLLSGSAPVAVGWLAPTLQSHSYNLGVNRQTTTNNSPITATNQPITATLRLTR